VAARLGAGDRIELLAPLGLDDLLALRIRPTPHMRASARGRAVYRARCEQKRWAARWPGVTVEQVEQVEEVEEDLDHTGEPVEERGDESRATAPKA
jgi:hypothetical protein